MILRTCVRGALLAACILLSGAHDARAGLPPADPRGGNARVVINIPSRTLTLLVDGRPRKTYPVGVGQRRWPTPIGQWRILEKVIDPVWGYPPEYDPGGRKGIIPPGPRNPLGTRWMGFTPQQHGIHGTNQPETVGKVISHGCVRMRIKDSEELFDQVRVGTPVEVRHDTVLVRVDSRRGLVLAAAYPDVYRRGGSTRKAVESQLERLQVRARLSGTRLRSTSARRDGVYRVVGWVIRTQPAPMPPLVTPDEPLPPAPQSIPTPPVKPEPPRGTPDRPARPAPRRRRVVPWIISERESAGSLRPRGRQS